MWSLFNTAKMWSKRPSELLAIEDNYVAYCFDEAVATWGTYIVNELDKITGKTDKEINRKRYNKLLQLLQAPDSMRFKTIRKPTKKK